MVQFTEEALGKDLKFSRDLAILFLLAHGICPITVVKEARAAKRTGAMAKCKHDLRWILRALKCRGQSLQELCKNRGSQRTPRLVLDCDIRLVPAPPLVFGRMRALNEVEDAASASPASE